MALAWCVGLTGGTLYCLYYLYARRSSRSSPEAPSPDQGPLWLRLFYEPRLPQLEQWIDSIPNKGLIRYHGIFNRERLLVTSPEVAKQFLTSEAYNFVKPELQSILSENISGRGLLTLEGDDHKFVKKLLNPAFSTANLKAWFPSMWSIAIDALNTVPSHAEAYATPSMALGRDDAFTGVAAMQTPIAAASIDMIGHFGYNVDFKTIGTMASSKASAAARNAKDPRARFGRAFIHMFKTTPRGQRTLEVASLVGPKIALKLPLRAVKTIKSIMAVFYDMMRGIVDEHMSAEVSKEHGTQAHIDILTHAIRAGSLSRADLVEQGVHMISGGTETSIATATWAVHLLSRHPEVQARLRDEIRANVPSPYDQAAAAAVEQCTLHKLPYLNAVVKEVLRFHSVNGILWRDCIKDTMLAGMAITKGTTVVFSPWALNRDPRHWGPTARVFDPDRWMVDPSGGADHPYSFLTFGGGTRRCIGEQYARDQLLCVICTYVGRYQLSPVDPLNGSDEGLEIGDNFALTLFKVWHDWKVLLEKIPGW